MNGLYVEFAIDAKDSKNNIKSQPSLPIKTDEFPLLNKIL